MRRKGRGGRRRERYKIKTYIYKITALDLKDSAHLGSDMF